MGTRPCGDRGMTRIAMRHLFETVDAALDDRTNEHTECIHRVRGLYHAIAQRSRSIHSTLMRCLIVERTPYLGPQPGTRPSRYRPRSMKVRNQAAAALADVDECAYCGRTAPTDPKKLRRFWHMEHVVPLYWGGADDLDNIVKACKQCNMEKGTKFWIPEFNTRYASGRRHRSLSPWATAQLSAFHHWQEEEYSKGDYATDDVD